MIYRTEIYVCDLCGKVQSFSEEGDPYSDPVIKYPEGWDAVETADGTDYKYLCPDCIEENRDKIETYLWAGQEQYRYKEEH